MNAKLRFVMSALLICVPLVHLAASVVAEGDSSGQYDHSFDLRSQYAIDARIHYRRYDIQQVLDVPDVKVLALPPGSEFLSYRTEFHNGTENGCLLVLNKIEDGLLKPFFVLEEVFYISKGDYYMRVLKKASLDSVEFALNRIIGEKTSEILTAEFRIKGECFELVSLRESHKGYGASALYFSDVYAIMKKRILQGTY
jgi:hypothetical protein